MNSILIVEKSHEYAESLEKTLGDHGFFVEIAESGIAAQRLARETEFDIILLDLQYFVGDRRPRSHAVEVIGRSTAFIRALRARRVTSPIIVYSSLKEEQYETAALDAGADDYVLKAGRCSILLARLHAHLRRRQWDLKFDDGENRRASVGRFVIDRRTRILHCDGKQVSLTSRELTFLERLAASSYRFVSIGEILADVWGETSERASEALDALIKRLRAKMKKHHLPDPIQMARGRGLKLSPALLGDASSVPIKGRSLF